jgi:hypothetical protein
MSIRLAASASAGYQLDVLLRHDLRSVSPGLVYWLVLCSGDPSTTGGAGNGDIAHYLAATRNRGGALKGFEREGQGRSQPPLAVGPLVPASR